MQVKIYAKNKNLKATLQAIKSTAAIQSYRILVFQQLQIPRTFHPEPGQKLDHMTKFARACNFIFSVGS